MKFNCSHGQHFTKGNCEQLLLMVLPANRVIVLLPLITASYNCPLSVIRDMHFKFHRASAVPN